MFIIPEFLVEDKHLPKVLAALSGIAIGLKAPRPVANVVVKKGEPKQATPGSSIAEVVANKVAASTASEITREEIKGFLLEAGGKESSISTYVTMLMNRKLIRHRKGRRGVYGIVK